MPSILQSLRSRWLGSVIRPTLLRTALKTIRNTPQALADYCYDAGRFFVHSSTFYYPTRDNRRARITAMYHSVERGLALPDPTPGFGEQNIALLIEAMDEYVRRFGLDQSLAAPTGALEAYLHFHAAIGITPPNSAAISALLGKLKRGQSDVGGTIKVSRIAIEQVTAPVTPEFFTSRYSIRQFSNVQIDSSSIDAAILIAQKSPSVCNRQECRVHVTRDRTLMAKMLQLQESRGFNHQIDTLLVLTNRLSAFYGTNERNQCWIDGGMFAMSLVLGFHAQGIGTCCLNWSKSKSRDQKMRKLLGLAPDEVIITLLAVGHLPTTLVVARSARPPVASARVDLPAAQTATWHIDSANQDGQIVGPEAEPK